MENLKDIMESQLEEMRTIKDIAITAHNLAAEQTTKNNDLVFQLKSTQVKSERVIQENSAFLSSAKKSLDDVVKSASKASLDPSSIALLDRLANNFEDYVTTKRYEKELEKKVSRYVTIIFWGCSFLVIVIICVVFFHILFI